MQSLFFCLSLSPVSNTVLPKTLYLHLVVSHYWRHFTDFRQFVFQEGKRYKFYPLFFSIVHSKTFIWTCFLATVQTNQGSSETFVGCSKILQLTLAALTHNFPCEPAGQAQTRPSFTETLPFLTLQTAPAHPPPPFPPSHRQLRCERPHEWVRVSGDHLLGQDLFSASSC